MKTSIGYTVSLNIVIVFIVIVFAFIMGSISYYKAYKVNSIIEDSIEKYEGFNKLSKEDINKKLLLLGYDMGEVNCGTHKVSNYFSGNGKNYALERQGKGYCVYYNVTECKLDNNSRPLMENTGLYSNYCQAKSYNYIIKTYLRFNIPIINSLLKIAVYTKTNSMYACYGGQC